MNLQTNIPIQPRLPKINYDSELVLLGSCFSENIGEKFEYYKFKTLINPFGILFHPKAIETFLWMATQQESYSETDLFQYNGGWHCFDAHSKLSNPNKDLVLRTLNEMLALTFQKIKSSTHIFITLGTAWVYRLQSMDMIVANCHKVPQKEFSKELLSVEEIVQCLNNSVHLIQMLNPKAKIVFTVSPVRHSKDGFIENNRSKSHLITAIHQVVSAAKQCQYFPSYEIMMDELRDYRFYERDMIHPNEQAIDYIWECFVKTWVDEKAIPVMDKVREIQKGLEHRPFNPQSKEHISFLENLEHKKSVISGQYSHIKWY